MRFSVRILSSDAGAACYEDIVIALREALTLCGHQIVGDLDEHDRLIVFGVLGNGKPPPGAIVFNTEQFATEKNAHLTKHLNSLRNNIIWDYSQSNAEWLRRNGLYTVLCPIGFVPSMIRESIIRPEKRDVDVLFYGSISERRRKMLEIFNQAGLGVRCINTYGKARDAWIARSKVILNMHFYDKAIFEIFRCAHLFANHKAVVSEDGGMDESLENLAHRAAVVVCQNDMVAACRSLCADEELRREYEERAYTAFREVDFVENVRQALEFSQ